MEVMTLNRFLPFKENQAASEITGKDLEGISGIVQTPHNTSSGQPKSKPYRRLSLKWRALPRSAAHTALTGKLLICFTVLNYPGTQRPMWS